jgi:hypothetical protein
MEYSVLNGQYVHTSHGMDRISNQGISNLGAPMSRHRSCAPPMTTVLGSSLCAPKLSLSCSLTSCPPSVQEKGTECPANSRNLGQVCGRMSIMTFYNQSSELEMLFCRTICLSHGFPPRSTAKCSFSHQPTSSVALGHEPATYTKTQLCLLCVWVVIAQPEVSRPPSIPTEVRKKPNKQTLQALSHHHHPLWCQDRAVPCRTP